MSLTMSLPMSLPVSATPATPFPATIQAIVLDTVLTSLALLFLRGAGGDAVAARQAAARMLAAYNPRNDDELRLAAIVTSFSFRALDALAQAAAPDLPVSRVLRLNGSAVSLSREAAKAERRLTQLRKAGETAIPAQAPAPEQIQAKEPPAPPPAQPLGKVAAPAKANGTTWTQTEDQRRREISLAASSAKAEAKFGPEVAAAIRADIAGNHKAAQAL